MLVTSDEGKVPGFSRPIGEAAGSEWEVHIRFVTGVSLLGRTIDGDTPVGVSASLVQFFPVSRRRRTFY